MKEDIETFDKERKIKIWKRRRNERRGERRISDRRKYPKKRPFDLISQMLNF